MISLRKITEENFEQCLDLEVYESQKKFVAPNIYSLAQAWLFFDKAFPFAIYHDEELVGFLMLGKFEKHKFDIWRFMIDEKFQNKGYGKKALELAIDFIKQDKDCEIVTLSFEPENKLAKKLYEEFGFQLTGKIEEGEVVMEFKLK